jgi:hypothetical protein
MAIKAITPKTIPIIAPTLNFPPTFSIFIFLSQKV